MRRFSGSSLALGGFESHDEQFLYYQKGNDAPGVWRMPVNGGREEPVLPEATRRIWRFLPTSARC
jgi:hypothetical protein